MKTVKSIISTVVAFSLILIGLLLVFNNFNLKYNGPISMHFDGKQFHNPEPTHTFGDMIRWFREMETTEWPKWIEDTAQPAPNDFSADSTTHITYINHSTLLIQTDSINILTDPIWSMRAGPFEWLGVKRVRKPGIDIDSLPQIHIVLISHDHYDHFDKPTLKKLNRRFSPTVIAGLGLKKKLERIGFKNVIELDWWQKAPLNNTEIGIDFVPSRHQSGRSPFDNDKTLWGGYVIHSKAGRIYFSGDSGYGCFIDELKNQYTSFKIALLPLGNYESRWFMKGQHMNPEDAVKIHKLFNVQQSMGMHFGTFAEHPEQSIDQHKEDLAIALDLYKINNSAFTTPKFGQRVIVK